MRIEGWIAGLHLVALSMQGHDDIPAFIKAFSGSNRYILDYLSEEVFSRQPEHVQTFLLHTSILDHLTGSLCDAVAGRSDSQSILEMLEQAGLFIVPLDDERRWYRYHHLFADILYQHLCQASPSLPPRFCSHKIPGPQPSSRMLLSGAAVIWSKTQRDQLYLFKLKRLCRRMRAYRFAAFLYWSVKRYVWSVGCGILPPYLTQTIADTLDSPSPRNASCRHVSPPS